MADELAQRLSNAEEAVETRRINLARIEAQEEIFRTELDGFKRDLQGEGIDPTQLDSLIETAEQELTTQLVALEEALCGGS